MEDERNTKKFFLSMTILKEHAMDGTEKMPK